MRRAASGGVLILGLGMISAGRVERPSRFAIEINWLDARNPDPWYRRPSLRFPVRSDSISDSPRARVCWLRLDPLLHLQLAAFSCTWVSLALSGFISCIHLCLVVY